MRVRRGRTSQPLFVEERDAAILELIRRNGKVQVDELARTFAVSAATARADLARLHARGSVHRTHGGAISASITQWEPPLPEREVQHRHEKKAIAKVAAEMVADGETVFIDAGSTCTELARELATAGRRLTAVTNSLPAAEVLAARPAVDVVLVGGAIQAARAATMGPLAAAFLEPMHFDRAFIGVSGADPVAGYTVVDFDAAAVKRAALNRSNTGVVLADASKLGVVAFAAIGPVSCAGLFITGTSAPAAMVTSLRKAGATVHVARP